MSAATYPVEIHVVAAPTEAFLLRVQLLAASIRRSGCTFAAGRIVVTLSRDCEPYDVAATFAWARELDVEFVWVPEDIWERHGIFGSAIARFRLAAAARAPYVIHLDADMLVTGPLDELPQRTRGNFGGVVAHVAPSAFGIPFRDGHAHHGAAFWSELHDAAALGAPEFTSEHTGWGFMDTEPARRWCPPYFNLGLLAGTREVMARVAEVIESQLATVESAIDTHFRCQLAVTLALAATGTPSVDLALHWNFPNDDLFAAAHPHAASDVRVLHYLRGGEFERERDTASIEALDAFLARPLRSPMQAQLQRALAAVRPGLGSVSLPTTGAMAPEAAAPGFVLRADVLDAAPTTDVLDASHRLTAQPSERPVG